MRAELGFFSIWIDSLRVGMASRGVERNWSLICSGVLQKYCREKGAFQNDLAYFICPEMYPIF